MEATVRLPEALADRLIRLATEEGVTVDGFVRILVSECLFGAKRCGGAKTPERISTKYSLVITSLPDVNVLLALLAEGHIHHTEARDWFSMKPQDSVAICRVTQMGLLRLLTNPRVLPAGAHSIQRAWDICAEVVADRRVFFESEPTGLEATWQFLMQYSPRSPGSTTTSW